MPLSTKRAVRKYVDDKLLFRFRRLFIFFIIIVAIVVDEVLHNYIAGYLAAAGFILGIVIGLLASRRMHRISWDAEAKQAVTSMDRVGIIILIAYLIFAVTRRWLFSYWLQGYGLTAFSLSIGAGSILGRLYTTRQKIRHLLKKEGILKEIKNEK
jgi:Na+/proline symporter